MIIFFSGTGNSRRCAHRLGQLLDDTDIHELTATELREPEKACLDCADADSRVIWVFPTYSWGVPPVVARFIKAFSIGKNMAAATHFMVTTCGDDMAYTDRQWRKLLTARGLHAAEAYAVIMPNTYVSMKGFDVDPTEVSRKKVADSENRLKEIAQSIENHGDSMLIRGAFPWVKSAVIYPWFKRYAMSPKPFHALDSCVSCSLCAKSCPMDNIEMVDGRPAWGDDCAMCLRCYHICPQHAVRYGKSTDGKGQWICKDL